MVASLSFQDSANAPIVNASIETIVYEDSAGNKYTFGVDNGTNVFNTFKYEPNGADEVDYSTIATNFMTNGAVTGLLSKLTTIETATSAANLGNKLGGIKTKTDNITDTLGADVTAIKAKTDKMPDNLVTELGALAKSAELASLAKTVDVTAIRTKTDKMPADLNAELIKLTAIEDAINSNGNVTEAAKAVLESSFKKAITDAEQEGSEWLRNEIKEIVSQPSFETPTDANAPLSWDW